jgi:hypothetical protein
MKALLRQTVILALEDSAPCSSRVELDPLEEVSKNVFKFPAQGQRGC